MIRSRLRKNRGTVIIAVLVALAVVMALLAQALLTTLRASRQVRRERDLRQCEFLLEAAAQRVTKEFADKTDLSDKKWTVSKADIAGTHDAQIRVERAKTEPQRSQWRIVAEYPAGNEWSIRRSQLIWINTTPQTKD